VFKRRIKKTWLISAAHAIYPPGGWTRALHYMKHRMHRLPDSPERIARGVFAGAFTVFTPFYGLHFLTAFLISKAMRGNLLAALTATFIGNPLTYFPIGVISLKTGHLMLGTEYAPGDERSLLAKFNGAGQDLWYNFFAVFTDRTASWDNLIAFWHDVFFPYLVGGIVPGIILGMFSYYFSLPVIRAYQRRRRNKLRLKLAELQRLAAVKADAAREDG
jgi:uncharacterized protein